MDAKRRDEGVALVMVIMVALVGSLLVVSGLYLTEIVSKPARQMPGKEQALLNANAAAQKALTGLKYVAVTSSPPKVDSISGSFGGGTYKAVWTDHGDSSYTVVATGTYTSYSRKIELKTKKVKISLDNLIMSGVGVVSGSSNVTLSGNAYVTGDNTDPPGCPPGTGDCYDMPGMAIGGTTGSLSFGGSTSVTGAAGASPDTLTDKDMLTQEEFAAMVASFVASPDTVAHYRTGGTETGLEIGTCSAPKVVIIEPGASPTFNGGTIYGVIVVKGDLQLKGNIDIIGLIVIADTGTVTCAVGNTEVWGGVMVGANNVSAIEWNQGGNMKVYYSCVALKSADATFTTQRSAFSLFKWREI